MREWSKHASSVIVTLILIPLIVQLLGWYVRGEDYNIANGLLVGAIFSVIAVILFVIGTSLNRLYLLLVITLVAVGMIVTVVGFVAVARSSIGGAGDNLDMLGVLVATCGLLVCCISAYLAYADLRGGIHPHHLEGRNPIIEDTREIEYLGKRIVVAKSANFQTNSEEILDKCLAHLDVADLHFIAYYVKRELIFYADVLSHPSLNRYFLQVDRGERRRIYEHAGRQLDWLVRELDVYLKRIEGGVLIRSVLDVEKGAVYYYLIDTDVHIMGVTLIQSSVDATDEKMTRIVEAVRGEPYVFSRV